MTKTLWEKHVDWVKRSYERWYLLMNEKEGEVVFYNNNGYQHRHVLKKTKNKIVVKPFFDEYYEYGRVKEENVKKVLQKLKICWFRSDQYNELLYYINLIGKNMAVYNINNNLLRIRKEGEPCHT